MVQMLGWYNHGNIGDESYKISFPTLFPNQKFSFGDVRSLSAEADCVCLGGGDILNEFYVKKLLAIPAKRRIAVSISSNINSPLPLLAKLDQIVVRDARSVKFLSGHGISCSYMPDVSTILKGNPVRGQQILTKMYRDEGLDLYQRRVGVVFNAHLCSGKSDMLARDHVTFNKVVNDLGKVMDDTAASFVFFPMSTSMPHDDRVTNAFLANRCKFWNKNLVIYDRLSVQDTLDLISCFDAVLSSRLHASIFSLTSGVPFLDLTHHDKNKCFLETIGMEDRSFSYWYLDPEPLKTLLKAILDQPNVYREELAQVCQDQLFALQKESGNVCFDQS